MGTIQAAATGSYFLPDQIFELLRLVLRDEVIKIRKRRKEEKREEMRNEREERERRKREMR